MESLIAALMIWIATHTSYDTQHMPAPQVRLLTPQQLTEEYYRDSGVAMPASGIDARIFALYNTENSPNGIVFLLDPRLDTSAGAIHSVRDEPTAHRLTEEFLDDPVFQEQLLHELVHHVQNLSGASKSFPCTAYGEREAYLLGGKFLSLNHATDPLPNRNFLAHMYSRC